MINEKPTDRKAKRIKREKGAIAFVSVFAAVIAIMFSALVLDFGLYYYKSAKLQNAVDAAATAAVTDIDAVKEIHIGIVTDYLERNGFSPEKYNFHIDVDTSGILREEDDDADAYISSGYMKVTVTVEDNAHIASILGISNFKLQKSAFVKAGMDYIAIPRALKYTIFAGSTRGTDASPALQINGKTGNITNSLMSKVEQFINGVNENIVQPIIGYFGGDPDYTDLIHITLSEAITDGDVHSNSNGSIGVQAVNASRIMDGNLTTIKKNPVLDDNGDPVLDDDGNVRYEPTLDSYGNYQYVHENANGNNDYNDYGQVTYTLVKGLKFNNTSDDVSTHVYVQNQQYIQDTQRMLSILSEVNMTNIASTDDLKNKFNTAAQVYIGTNDSTGREITAEDIEEYKSNLSYDNLTETVNVSNQRMIVYDTSRDTANTLLANIYDEDKDERDWDAVFEHISRFGKDPVFESGNSGNLMYQGTADKASDIEYSIIITQNDSSDQPKDVEIKVTGITANRDVKKTGATTEFTLSNSKAAVTAGTESALAYTFQDHLGNNGIIPTPNMKPYFVREINKSIKNATKSREELADSEEAGQRNIRAAVAEITNEINDLFERTGFTDETYVEKIDDTPVLKSEAYDLLFKYKKSSDSSGLTELTGAQRTTFKGIELIKRVGDEVTLNTPTEVINNTPYANNYTESKVNQFKEEEIYVDDDHSNANVTDYQNHYGKEAVDKKRKSLENEYSPSSVIDRYGAFTDFAPSNTDIFLTSGSTPYAKLQEGLEYAKSTAADASMEGSSATVSMPSITEPAAIADTVEKPDVNNTLVLGSNSYNLYDIAAGTTTVSSLISDYSTGVSWASFSGDGLIRCNNSGGSQSSSSGNYHTVKNGNTPYMYNGSYDGNRPYVVRSNTLVYNTGYMHTGEKDNVGMLVYNDSVLMLGGENKYNRSYALYASNRASIANGSTIICNGSAYFKYISVTANRDNNALTIGNSSGGATLIVNGDLRVVGRMIVNAGSNVIVTGNLIVDNGIEIYSSADKNTNFYIGGKISYAGSSNDGTLGGAVDTTNKYSSITTGTTFVLLNNGDDNDDDSSNDNDHISVLNYALHIQNGATFYSNGTVKVWNNNGGNSTGEGFVVENGGKAFVHNLTHHDGSNYLYVSNSGDGKLYSDGKITATSLDATNSSVHLNELELTGNFIATNAYCTGSVSVNDISTWQSHFTTDVTTNTISYYGSMIVDGNLKINGNYSMADAPMLVNSLECTGTLVNNYSKTTVTDTLKSADFTNNGNIVAGNIYITNDLVNGSESNVDATIYANATIKVDGALTNYGKIAALAADNGSDKTFNIGGTTDNKGNAVIYAPNGSYSTNNLTLNIGSNFTTGGSLIIRNLLINKIDLKIGGSFSAKRIQNDKVIYCPSSVQLEYFVNSAGAVFACDGSLTISSQVDNSSIVNEGLCYINGNLSTAGAVYVNKGALYVNGDLSGANATAYENALIMNNHSQVYVQGRVKSEREDKHIYILPDTYDGTYAGAPTKTILSIYNAQSPLIASGKEIVELCNLQPGSTVYLGTGTIATGSELIDRTINLSGNNTALQSAGDLYVFGNLTLSNANNISITGNGKTYIKGKLTAQNSKLTITGGPTAGVDFHEFVCWDNVKISELEISNTRFYSLGALTVSSSVVSITNGSIFYSGESSSIDFSSSNISISASTIYLPRISGTFDYFGYMNSGAQLYGIITESDVKFTQNLTIPEGLTFYIGGKTTFENDIEVANNGKLYMMGNVDLRGIKNFNETKTTGINKKTNNKIECLSFGENSDTFIGHAVDRDNEGVNYTNTVCFPATFIGNGTIYLDNDLYAGLNMDFNEDLKAGEFVGNRRAAISIKTGHTYVSGMIKTYDNTGLLVEDNAALSCSGDLVTGSVIYNYGKLVAMGNHLPSTTASKPTDRADGNNMHGGFSIKNGASESDTNDFIFIGGTDSASTRKDATLYGYVVNYGQYYHNAGLSVQGFVSYDGMQSSSDCAIVNHNGAKLIVGGDTCLNANAFFNDENAVFNCSGKFDYGICIANCNEFVAEGDIVQNYYTNGNSSTWRNDKSMSIMNGFRKLDGSGGFHSDAVLYCGGTLKLGASENGGEAGSLVNMGSVYVGNDLLVYCNKSNSYFLTAIWNFNQANMVVGGNCFGGGGIVTGNNSVFMCGKGFESKRSTKINANVYKRDDKAEFTYSDENKYNSAYFYVGGDMLANVLGKSVGSWDNSNIKNSSRDLDIYANTNMYVGGKFYANSKLYMKQNVTILVGGEDHSSDDISLNNVVGSMANTPFTLYISKCIDENICSNLIVNGAMHVRDTAKIRDMTKTFIYGEFSCEDYVEVGKSLSEGSLDETEAKLDKYKATGENNEDYVFSNAGKMFVGGNFTAQKYFKLYASTTMRVTGNCVSERGYITLRHDANLYAGGKVESLTSIDVGSYATVVAGGNMKAKTSTIKIRDNVTCFVGGDMTALRYIELGKFGDYTRHIINASSLSSFPNPNSQNTTYKPGYLYHANDTGKYYFWSAKDQTWKQSDYSGVPGGITEGSEAESCNCCDKCTDSEGCTCGCSNCKWKSGSSAGGSTDAGADTSHDNEGEGVDASVIATQAEIGADDSDIAHGSSFYVGGALASYTGYIREFAYSGVTVGNYVFTPKYLTLRHNADMWVMPETFSNSTYVRQHYEGTSDGTLWGDIKNELGKIAFDVAQTFTPKTGSIYTLGELTLNKNASLMGTYDCTVNGKCVLRQDSLIYLGHDFTLTAPSLNLSVDSILGSESVCGFDTYGTNVNGVAYPVVIYADNAISIMTTLDMKLTYLVANRGDVKLYDIYSRGDNAQDNATHLPNAIASYNGNIDYFAMYGKLGALLYCPNGNLDLDGYYLELWGSGIGDTVKINSYYFAMHRFSNWKTMNLHMARAGKISIISQKEYEDAEVNDNTDNIFDFNRNGFDMTDHDAGGVDLFFDVNNN